MRDADTGSGAGEVSRVCHHALQGLTTAQDAARYPSYNGRRQELVVMTGGKSEVIRPAWTTTVAETSRPVGLAEGGAAG